MASLPKTSLAVSYGLLEVRGLVLALQDPRIGLQPSAGSIVEDSRNDARVPNTVQLVSGSVVAAVGAPIERLGRRGIKDDAETVKLGARSEE